MPRRRLVFGQESNPTTWRLAKMNLAIRGIDRARTPNRHGFTRTCTRIQSRFRLANPPFNDSDWRGELLRDRPWVYGAPPAGNANFAWVQHLIYHIAPNGHAGFVFANGTLSSSQAVRARSAGRSSRRKSSSASWHCRGSSSKRRSTRFCGSSPRSKWNGGSATAAANPVHRRPEVGTMIDRCTAGRRCRCRQDRGHVPRLAWRQEREEEVRGRTRLLQIGETRRHLHSRIHSDTRPLCRRGGGGGRRRTVRRKNAGGSSRRCSEQQAEAAKLDAVIAASLQELGYAG